MSACANPLQPAPLSPFHNFVKNLSPTGPLNPRGRFQFSNAQAQRAEARLNLKEAVALAARWAPAPKAAPDAPASTPAGACFRKVMVHLKGTSSHGR